MSQRSDSSTAPSSLLANEVVRLIPGFDPFATAAEGEWFDADAAQFAIDFFGECLQFVEGQWAGKPFQLEPWQAAIVANLWGWKRADGTRRFREALIYVPRKNAKTTLIAGMINLHLFTDGEPGAQAYSAAADREQASLIFRHATAMIRAEPMMASACRILDGTKTVVVRQGEALFKALSSDAKTKHGLSPSFAAIDELHAHKNGELAETLTTGMGARRQPLTVYMTTADYARESKCNSIYRMAKEVRDGKVKYSAFLPVIYEASIDDDWTSEETWRKANPNFGVSIKPEFLKAECEKAKIDSTYEQAFKRLYLNIQTSNETAWLDVKAWNELAGAVDLEGLRSRRCWGGLDLSANRDLSAFALWFPPEDDKPGVAVVRCFLPEEIAEQRERMDRVPYTVWARSEWVTLTPGSATDYETIRKQIIADCERFDVADIGADRWNLEYLRQKLVAEGCAEIVPYGQGFASMSQPSKELERLVVNKQITHDGNECLAWQIGNVTIKSDEANNIKPTKGNRRNKIDGVVALIMAIGRWMQSVEVESPYENHRLTVL